MIEVSVTLARESFKLDVDVRLEAHTTSLFGASGSGKTTLLHVMTGITRPDAGRIAVGDRVLFDSARGIDLPIEARRIGVVFQDARLFPHLSVAQNLRYGERVRSNPVPSTAFERIVELLALEPLLERRPRTLSGGEAQRVSIGRALMSNPDVLLLDEPLSGLDADRRSSILPFLRDVRDHLATPMIYVAHDLVESQEIATQHVVLSDGRVIGQGPAADLAMAGTLPPSVPFVNVFVADAARSGGPEGTTHVRLPGGAPLVVASPIEGGARRLLAVRPEDVALAGRPGQELSFQNQLEGTITRHAAFHGQVLVDVDVSGCALIAIVSAHAFETMHLERGRTVWCLIKSNAIRDLGGC